MSTSTPGVQLNPACPECGCKNTAKKGKRRNRLQTLQIYRCTECLHRFTGTPGKNKTYPFKLVLETISAFNLGHSLTETQAILRRRFHRDIPERTISSWLTEYRPLTTYARLRPQARKLYPADSVIRSHTFHHRQVYRFQVHQAKLDLLTKPENAAVLADFDASALRNYLASIETHFPHHFLQEAEHRSSNVRVTAAVTNAGTGLGLPAGYTANVVSGTPLPGPKWITLGTVTIPQIRAGYPEIAFFDLPSTVLPMPASLPGNSHWCMVVFMHGAQDPFTNTITNVDALTVNDRKVGQRNLEIVEFVGTPPPPGTGIGMWAMLLLSGAHFKQKGLADLAIDASRFKGDLHFLPKPIFSSNPERLKGFKKGPATIAKQWLSQYPEVAKRLFFEAKYPEQQYRLLNESMAKVANATPLMMTGGTKAELSALPLGPNDEHAIFMRIDPPKDTKVGTTYEFDVIQRESRTRTVLGGVRYRVVANKPYKR